MSEEKLRQSTLLMEHRGPDDEQFAVHEPVFFGFRRLKIIDPGKGQQPMYNEDRSLCLVLNGEIYNYLELRTKLQKKGHVFKSESDSEVVLHLYEEEGEDCVRQLRGMFAFCIYDRNKELLFGARDRFGIKPLFYLETPAVFALASEAKALLDLPGYNAGVNMKMLPHYFTYQFVPEPQTMFAGIYKVPPAHTFNWCRGRLSLKRYWQPSFQPRERPLPELLAETKEVLCEAVRLHTQSDVPLGSFLSGGIDSTIIAALLQQLCGRVSTFSVGYEESAYSELSEAAASARYLGTQHREYVVGHQEFWQHLPKLIWHMDEPVADPAAVSLYFVARLAREKITVTLSGEGADEVFGGYGIYREPGALRPAQLLPRPALQVLTKVSHRLPVPGKNYLRRAMLPLHRRFLGNSYIFTEEEKGLLLKEQGFPSAFTVTDPLYEAAAKEGYDDVTKMQYIDLHTWLPGDILVKADKMTMANSLELRVPFLDHHVFAFASEIPQQYKIRRGLTKYLLRESFAGMVPDAARKRPKKGFPVPTRVWLQGPLAGKAAEVLADPALERFFSRSYAAKLLKAHREGRADNSRKLWTLLVFSLWYRCFFKN